ncbi:MAG: methyltransferase domain-containing protein, partial [Opitutales bacterium]
MTDSSDITYDLSLLEKSMSAWKKSPGLRDYYASLYRDMADEGIGARPLEIGSGIAASREFLPRLTTSDIVKTPYVDRAVSAYDIPLPEAGNVWTSILALDVFHHMREPLRFIESASRALEPGGKIILMEPCASVFGRCFYSLFHVEPMERKSIEPPCSFEPNGPDSSYANMAIAYELVNRHREWFNLQLSQYGLKLSKVG